MSVSGIHALTRKTISGKKQAAGTNHERFFPNTGGADVSIRPSIAPSIQRILVPAQRISQARDRKLDLHYRCNPGSRMLALRKPAKLNP